ncbi:MAG: hypothetical protein FWG37_05425, partial [Clostridia bacterium]|nr:hypothetical protein [Clostridia bacterium]
SNSAKNITLTDVSLAYLQDSVGDTIIAGSQSELLLLGSISYETLYTNDMASLAVLGNIHIEAADQKSTGRIFDPNQMLPAHTPEGAQEADAGSNGGGKGRAQKEEGPYPDYLIEWVFGSTPTNPGGPSESFGGMKDCGCCSCKNVCYAPQSLCCKDCKCTKWVMEISK